MVLYHSVLKMLKFVSLMLLVLEISMENFFLKFHQSDYKVEFQWAELISWDKTEVSRCEIVTFKYNRTCTALNLTFKYNFYLGNELEIITQAYKFASNEYRQFPLRFEANFCDAVKYDVIGLNNFSKCGNFSGCPFLKRRHYHMCNWMPNESKFPPYVPNGKYMVEMQGLYRSREMWTSKAYFNIYRPIKM